MDLINPLTRHHVKLPSLTSLRFEPPIIDLPSKIILSTSPDDDEGGGGECRALLGYGCDAFQDIEDVSVDFCCPSQSYTWDTMPGEYLFSSFAYSRRQKLFFCLYTGYTSEMQAWDLRDTLSPKMMTRMDLLFEKRGDSLRVLLGPNEDIADCWWWWRPSYLLVVNDDTDDLFVVTRFFNVSKMMMFDVHRYDPKSETFQHMDRSLDGLSFFVDDSMKAFAVSAEEFPELKPDSIYFVLSDNRWPPERRNVGIYNYKDATISPLCDLPSFTTFKPVPLGLGVGMVGQPYQTPQITTITEVSV